MKSDVINVTNTGEGMEAALQAASASAVYRGLGKKDAIHLRLLAEEMMGMLRQIAGGTGAEFWVTSEGPQFELHLTAHPLVTGKMRKELLGASTSGKNEAAKGFMGKIRDIIDRALTSEGDSDQPTYFMQGLLMPSDMDASDPMMYSTTSSMVSWSMRNYRTAVEAQSVGSQKARDEWDELEKSIVANIADEVRISIAGDKVEMTVYKNFEN